MRHASHIESSTLRRFRARWAWLLLLPLAVACHHKETEDGDGTADGNIQLKRNGTWQSQEKVSARIPPDAPSTLEICGVHDPIPNGADDENGVCVTIQLDAAVPGSGAKTLAIDGSAEVPPARPPSVTYTAGAAQAPEVKSVLVSTSCFSVPPTDTVTHQVSGELRLVDNTATRLAGHLTLSVEGTTYGPCSGEAAEFDVDFDVTR